MLPIVRGLINFCWFFFKWGLLACMLGAVIAVTIIYQQVDEEIRRRVEEAFARRFPNLTVTVRSAELIEGEGIEIRGLAIVERNAQGPRAELLHLEEAFIACPADLGALVSGDLDVRRVVLRRPTLRATRRPDGSWSVAKLLSAEGDGPPIPEVGVENGTIEIFDPLRNPSGMLTLRVNLELRAPVDAAASADGLRGLRGTLTGDFLRFAKVDGWIDLEDGGWELAGAVEGLDFSPHMRASLPCDVAAKLAALDNLSGSAEVRFRVGRDPSEARACRFELDGRFSQGRLDDPRLPNALTDVEADFRVNNDGITVYSASASSGRSTVSVNLFRLFGFDLTSPMWLDAQVRQLELNRQLRDILPDPLRAEWDHYRLEGRIDADVKLAHDGNVWRPRVSIQCLNVSTAYHEFPYPLENATGLVELKNDTLTFSLTGYSGSRPIQVWGEASHPGPGAVFWLKAQGEDLPIDEKVFDALRAVSGKTHDFISSFHPHGPASFFWHVHRDEPGQPSNKHLTITLNGCSVKYDEFRYPVSNIRGTIRMNGRTGMGDDLWEFIGLEGTNDTARVTCRGELRPTPEGKWLALSFTGTDVPLEEELRDALPQANVRQLWDNLTLRGMIDVKDLEVRYLVGQGKPRVSFRAVPHSEKTSIKLVHFPYQVDDIRGTLIYRDGHVAVEEFEGWHGRTKLKSTVACDFFPDGSWDLRLNKLVVDQLLWDHELIRAQPEGLRRIVSQLNPSGPMNLRGSVGVSRGSRPGDPLSWRWDVKTFLYRGSLDVGVDLTNVHGAVHLKGGYDGRRLQSRGDLEIDSLMWKDVQLTRVDGPFWIDNDRVLLGSV
ncbi:MAG: AsmA family protein, partial [Planctomycetota bacterium]